MKKIIIMVVISIITVTFAACFDDDFSPYEDSVSDVSILLDGNAYTISSIEQQITDKADEYLNGAVLCHAEYIYTNEQDIKASFFFDNEHKGKDIHDVLYINVDVVNNSIYSIQKIHGLGKRLPSYSGSYIGNGDININDYLKQILNNSEYIKSKGDKDNYIWLVFDNDDIIACSVSATDKTILWRNKFSGNSQNS